MNKQEYENKKRECWEEYCQLHPKYVIPAPHFEFIFDRAYALGKQEKESKSMQLSDAKQKIDEWMENHSEEEVYEILKKYSAIEDADTVIQGWVARDSHGGFLFAFNQKPSRYYNPKEYDGSIWVAPNKNMLELDEKLFPDLKSTDDPIEVEITIKRKKK